MYQEKINELRAVEARLDSEKLKAQQDAAALVQKAEQDGRALVASAKESLRQADLAAKQQTEAQADVRREQMLAETERACAAMRDAAAERMDAAVAHLVEKVVEQ